MLKYCNFFNVALNTMTLTSPLWKFSNILIHLRHVRRTILVEDQLSPFFSCFFLIISMYSNTPLQAPHILNVTNRLTLDGYINICLCTCSYQGPFVKLVVFVTELGGKSTNYRHLVRCRKIYINQQ